jgi:hypothetical protein
MARMTKALSGAEARGQTDSPYNIPYKITYGYDPFGHRTDVSYKNFAQGPNTRATTYVNNRISGKDYDADGNLMEDPWLTKTYTFNGGGQLRSTAHEYYASFPDTYIQNREYLTYNGNGSLDKIETVSWENDDPPVSEGDGEKTYRVRSTALGGAVLYESGAGAKAFVVADGMEIARVYDRTWQSPPSLETVWKHIDLNMRSQRATGAGGTVMGTGVTGDDNDMIELDPEGKSIGFSDPGLGWTTDPQDLFNSETSFGSLQNGIFTSYSIDGLNIPYDTFMMEAGRLGRSLDVGCTRGRVWVNPYSVYQEYRMINDCIDNMTLARHGIFAYEVPGQERIPARWGYAFSSTSRDSYTSPVNDGEIQIGGGGTLTDKLPFNSCREFANWIAEWISIPPFGVGRTRRDRATLAGMDLMSFALDRYEDHINNGFAGFKPELVNAGVGTARGEQGAGVYGHLLGQAGAYLYGGISGNAIAYGADIYDRVQGFFGDEQSPSEIAGNAAGTVVGRFLWSYLKGDLNKNGLKNKLTSELCVDK